MPKNTKGGKRFKKQSKGAAAEFAAQQMQAKAPLKEDNQEYATVTKMLGNGRILCKMLNTECKEIMAIIPGKFKKRRKIWINKEDLILINIREYQDDKADVIYKYNPQETKQLVKKGEINLKLAESDDEDNLDNDDLGIDFEEDEIEKAMNNDLEIDLEDL